VPILPEGGARASKINNRLQYLFSLSFSLVIEEEIEHYNSVYETLPRLITQNVLQPKESSMARVHGGQDRGRIDLRPPSCCSGGGGLVGASLVDQGIAPICCNYSVTVIALFLLLLTCCRCSHAVTASTDGMCQSTSEVFTAFGVATRSTRIHSAWSH
jgi:hypothetical protein